MNGHPRQHQLDRCRANTLTKTTMLPFSQKSFNYVTEFLKQTAENEQKITRLHHVTILTSAEVIRVKTKCKTVLSCTTSLINEITKSNISNYNYPTPDTIRDRVLFSIDFFVSLFVSLSARLRENGWTDLHEIFREGTE